MAKGTPGMSGADLANLVNEAALFAVRRGSKEIERIDFESARDRIMMGARRESLVLTVEEKRATAYHEGGHALLATVLPHADQVHKVTILPTGMALGVTQTMPEERHAYSRDHLLDRICMTMGGRVAEELVFNQRTTGAANDLEVATRMAKRMVREWGMSDRIGPMAWESQGQVFLGEDLMTGATGVLRRHRPAHRRGGGPHPARAGGPGPDAPHQAPPGPRPGGQALLEKETIEGSEVARLVQEGLSPNGAGPHHRPPPLAERRPAG